MNLGIIGSRTFNNYSMLKKVMQKRFMLWDLYSIVSGVSEDDSIFRGADTLGRDYALENNIKYIGFPADWEQYGKRAGFLRNTDIVNNSDCLLSFWDGSSRGTKDTMDKALKQGKDCLVVEYLNKKIYYYKG